MDSKGKGLILLTITGIQTVIAGHFVVGLRYVLDQKGYEVQSRNCFLYKSIVFVAVVMESNIFTIVRINAAQCDDRASKVAGDVSDNSLCITEIGLGVNIETVFILFIDGSFGLLERGTDALFHFIK